MNAAHVKLDSTDVVIVPLDVPPESSDKEQLEAIRDNFQKLALNKMLLGHVILVWKDDDGKLVSHGPDWLCVKLRSASWTDIRKQLNIDL